MSRRRPEHKIPMATVRALWLDTSRSLEDLAASVGLSRPALAYKAKVLGLPPRGRNAYQLQKIADDDFSRLWMAGVAAKDIAAHFGYRDLKSVAHRRVVLGLPKRTRGHNCGRRWAETISMTEFMEAELAARMAAAAAQDAEARRSRRAW